MRWFTEVEVAGLDPKLVSRLEIAREYAGVPFIITSGRRTAGENEAAGGVDASSHLKGLGVDLRASFSSPRFRIVRGLLLAGFRRIGVYNKHVHADVDDSLPQQVLWVSTSH